MLVRPADVHDTGTIADVFVASFRGLAFHPVLHTDDEIRSWIRGEMVPAHEVWVVGDEGGVVAFAAVKGDLLGHLLRAARGAEP